MSGCECLIRCLFLQSIFTLLLGPFTFFSAQKTKYLQILTSLMRWMGKSKTNLARVWRRFLPSWRSPFPQFALFMPLFFHQHTFLFSVAPSSFLLSLAGLRSAPSIMVWVPLRVFDSHLLSSLSLTGSTARPRLDWTVTHRETGGKINHPSGVCC